MEQREFHSDEVEILQVVRPPGVAVLVPMLTVTMPRCLDLEETDMQL